jgi:hypothetical protein
MATTATTRVDQETAFSSILFVAFELGVNKWKLGCTTGAAQRPSPSMGDGKGGGGQRRLGTRIYRSSQYAAAQQRPDTSAVGSVISTRPPR